MPKRSNDFQRLIKAIYSAMANVDGGKVTESAILHEPNGTSREVDILLESSVYDVPLIIAVECRDRSRKSDIEWIDGLIGKYHNLSVHKIIAVSRLGFSASSLEKATSANIDVRSLEQCENADWSGEFMKLGVGKFALTPLVESVNAVLSPPPIFSVTLESIIENHTGKPYGTFKCMLSECYETTVFPRIKEIIAKDLLPGVRVLEDLRRKRELTIPVDIHDAFVRGQNDARSEIKKLTFNVKTETELTTSMVDHFKYGEKVRASIATLEYPTAKQKLRIVQVAGSNQLSITSELSEKDGT